MYISISNQIIQIIFAPCPVIILTTKSDILMIVGVTLVAGFLTFLMRQTIIVTSRLIEFDLKY